MEKYGIVIDDDPAILALALRVLSRQGKMYGFLQVEQGMDYLYGAAYIISDYDMPGMGGEGLIRMVRSGELRVPLIILSGYDSSKPEIHGLEHLGIEFLPKPFSNDELLARTSLLLNPR